MTAAHLMQTYASLPVAFARGEGAWLWDTEGKRYLDALAGIAVNGLGHAHPVLVRALAEAVVDAAREVGEKSALVEIPLCMGNRPLPAHVRAP